MQFIVMGRRAGKTTRMIEALKEHKSSILIVASDNERRRVVEEYKLSWGDADRVLTPQMARNEFFCRKRPAKVYVDNIDLIITQFLGVLPDVATLTAEGERQDWR